MYAATAHVDVLSHRNLRVSEVIGTDPGRHSPIVDQRSHRLTEAVRGHPGSAQLIADPAPLAAEVVWVAPGARGRREHHRLLTEIWQPSPIPQRVDPKKHVPELGRYRVTTLMYTYELVVDGSTVWSMHWHPDGQGAEFRPHYHLSGGDDHPFSVKDHLPSGRHTIEDAVEWCILHGAVAADDKWETVIAETKGVHVLHRSWSNTPNEPRG
jgi:hypothetical protein